MKQWIADWGLLATEILLIIGVVFALLSCNFYIPNKISVEFPPKEEPPPVGTDFTYTKDVKPILDSRCATCHGNGRTSGGYSIDGYEDVMRAVVSGKSGESPLCIRVKNGSMPLGGSPLDGKDVNLICDWIDEGAKK